MKILFLDESGDHSLTKIDEQYPVFCLAGTIIDEKDYLDIIDPKINELKVKHWGTKDVILHSREIRKCKPPFNNLLAKATRENFYSDLDNLITEIPITVIATVIRKKDLCQKYTDPSNPYETSLMFLMERYLHYLEENHDIGYITIESRDPKSNKDLFEEYSSIMSNGTYGPYSISSNRYNERIQKIEFVTKKQNENGHQLADLVAYPIANWVLYPDRKNIAFDIVKTKFRRKGNRIQGYGLKVFP